MGKNTKNEKNVKSIKNIKNEKNVVDTKNKNVSENQQEILEERKLASEEVRDDGTMLLNHNRNEHKIELICIIGEIEGHENLGSTSKTTKYEHILPKLAQIEDSDEVDGVLFLLNTMGGDVEAGLAIAEMIASLSKPTVSLVLGGSHSIGVPIAVSTDYSFIVETGTMVIHPVRLNGMVIGTPATYDYFKSIQDRITGFVVSHSRIEKKQFEKLMMETKILTKDVGSVIVGETAVNYGIINEVGGISDAVLKLHELIDDNNQK